MKIILNGKVLGSTRDADTPANADRAAQVEGGRAAPSITPRLAEYLSELFGDAIVGVNLAEALVSEFSRRSTDRKSMLSFLTMHAGSLEESCKHLFSKQSGCCLRCGRAEGPEPEKKVENIS
jgi:hypothetical protein